jgi:hypothetical protein
MTMRNPRPLVELMPISDIYADGIAEVESLGDNFRTIYYTYTRPYDCDEAIERVVVAKIVRPKKSIIRVGDLQEWLAREEKRERKCAIVGLHS